MEYATTAVTFSAGSSSKVKIDGDQFTSNGTAISISAAIGTNAQIENNLFDSNTVAINASSNWSTVTADPVNCFYNPLMTATGNTFDGSKVPIVTHADHALITGGNLASLFGVPTVEEYPGDWAENVRSGSTDTISVSYEPCIDVIDPLLSYVAIAIPLDLGGSIIGPFAVLKSTASARWMTQGTRLAIMPGGSTVQQARTRRPRSDSASPTRARSNRAVTSR